MMLKFVCWYYATRTSAFFKGAKSRGSGENNWCSTRPIFMNLAPTSMTSTRCPWSNPRTLLWIRLMKSAWRESTTALRLACPPEKCVLSLNWFAVHPQPYPIRMLLNSGSMIPTGECETLFPFLLLLTLMPPKGAVSVFDLTDCEA